MTGFAKILLFSGFLLLSGFSLTTRWSLHSELTQLERKIMIKSGHLDDCGVAKQKCEEHAAVVKETADVCETAKREAVVKAKDMTAYADTLSRKLEKFVAVDVDALQRRIHELTIRRNASTGGDLASLLRREAEEQCGGILTALEEKRTQLRRLNATLFGTKAEAKELRGLVLAHDDELANVLRQKDRALRVVDACEVELHSANRTLGRLKQELDMAMGAAAAKMDASNAIKERHIFELQASLKEAQRDANSAHADSEQLIDALRQCEARGKGDGGGEAAAKVDAKGFCAGDGSEHGHWVRQEYVPRGCAFQQYDESAARTCLAGKRVMLYGDETMKEFGYALFGLLHKSVIEAAREEAAEEDPPGAIPLHFTQEGFCRPLKRNGALPGCEFGVKADEIRVEWYNEPHYQSPPLKVTIGELRRELPDVVVASGGAEHVLRQQHQWKKRLFEELPPMLEWLSSKFSGDKSSDRQFYWRTNLAVPGTQGADHLLRAADNAVMAMVRDMYGFGVVHVGPSTRATGAMENVARWAHTHVQMWLNVHCNAN